MRNVKESYSKFHRANCSNHLYPTEWIIRTLLGNYPDLNMDKSAYPGARLLDLGFGDCRNMTLLKNCGFEIYGVEISADTVELGYTTLERLGIHAQLTVGSNTHIPFNDGFFRYLLASSSCYYVDDGTCFDDSLKEISRVLNPGGYLIANVPVFVTQPGIPQSFILQDSKRLNDGHVSITNDVYGLRNGYTFRAFSSNEEVESVFGRYFEDIAIGLCMDNHYGVQINYNIICARKRLESEFKPSNSVIPDNL